MVRVLSEGESPLGELLRGDLVLFRGEAAEGEAGLLVPRGYGRPCFGVRTDGGLRIEPGGVRCPPERWAMAGRVVAHVRSFRIRPSSRHVLRSESNETELTVAPTYPRELRDVEGPWVAIDLGTAVEPSTFTWLGRRMSSLAEVGGGMLLGQCPWIHEGAPVMRAGALIAELRDHFDLRAAVGVARSAPAAVSAMAVAMPSAVVWIMPEAAELWLEAMPVEPAAQMALFGGDL